MKKHKADIEKEVLSRPGPWIFDEKVSHIFEEHVRKSIPCYDLIQNLIGMISREVLKDKDLVYDLGTATGEVICTIQRYNPEKNLQFIGIDNSLPMLERAREKCAGIGRAEFIHQGIEEMAFARAGLIVSAFTLQFVGVEKRLHVLSRIRESLGREGHFILCEKVCCSGHPEADFYQGLYEQWKLNYFTPEEITAKRERLTGVMKVLSIPENIRLMRSAGFTRIESFFQWCNFICFFAAEK